MKPAEFGRWDGGRNGNGSDLDAAAMKPAEFGRWDPEVLFQQSEAVNRAAMKPAEFGRWDRRGVHHVIMGGHRAAMKPAEFGRWDSGRRAGRPSPSTGRNEAGRI